MTVEQETWTVELRFPEAWEILDKAQQWIKDRGIESTHDLAKNEIMSFDFASGEPKMIKAGFAIGIDVHFTNQADAALFKLWWG